MERTFEASRFVCFFEPRPKLRAVFAADLRDRMVQHLLVDDLERGWEPIFIHESYACRGGKDVHRAVARLHGFLRRVTADRKMDVNFLAP